MESQVVRADFYPIYPIRERRVVIVSCQNTRQDGIFYIRYSLRDHTPFPFNSESVTRGTGPRNATESEGVFLKRTFVTLVAAAAANRELLLSRNNGDKGGTFPTGVPSTGIRRLANGGLWKHVSSLSKLTRSVDCRVAPNRVAVAQKNPSSCVDAAPYAHRYNRNFRPTTWFRTYDRVNHATRKRSSNLLDYLVVKKLPSWYHALLPTFTLILTYVPRIFHPITQTWNDRTQTTTFRN